MIIKDYYDIENIELPDKFDHIFITSTITSKYVQQLKLGFLYLADVYKGTSQNRNIFIETKDHIISKENTQIRFLPADVYYKRDIDYSSNSIISSTFLNIMQNNPKYLEDIERIYGLINSIYNLQIDTNVNGVELNIEASDVNLKKLMNLIDVNLYKDDKELEEIQLTEFELKILYMKIINMMYADSEDVYYLIESPEAGLNYKEKQKFMEYLQNFKNVIIFSNDIDILKNANEINDILIINKPNYKNLSESLVNELKTLFQNNNIQENYLELSEILLSNLEYLLKDKDLEKINNMKVKNIIMNYVEKIE